MEKKVVVLENPLHQHHSKYSISLGDELATVTKVEQWLVHLSGTIRKKEL